MSWAVVAGLVALAALAGAGLGRAAVPAGSATDPPPAEWRWAVAAAAGLAALHLAMLLLDLAGVPWGRPALGASLGAVAAGGWGWATLRRRRRAPAGERTASAAEHPPAARRPGWGDALALAALGTYTALAWRLNAATPDFVYHWGIKGHRYALARGVDWGFLADPLRLTDHPDYPNLVPDLYAATALLAGRFDERAMMLWSAVLFGLMLLAARAAWRRTGTGGFAAQAGTAAVGLAVGMFALGYLMAGGADWTVALAALLAAPALLAPAGRGGPFDDWAVGVAAAVAAAGKIEGVALAAVLVAVHLEGVSRRDPADAAGAARGRLGRWWPGRRPPPTAAVLRCALPPLAVALPWLVCNLELGLFQGANAGGFEPSRAATIAAALADTLGTPEWHGLAWLALGVPLLAVPRRTRRLGVVLTLQLAVYLAVYFSARADPRLYVLMSFPRLLFHLLPATLVGGAVLVAGTRR